MKNKNHETENNMGRNGRSRGLTRHLHASLARHGCDAHRDQPFFGVAVAQLPVAVGTPRKRFALVGGDYRVRFPHGRVDDVVAAQRFHDGGRKP